MASTFKQDLLGLLSAELADRFGHLEKRCRLVETSFESGRRLIRSIGFQNEPIGGDLRDCFFDLGIAASGDHPAERNMQFEVQVLPGDVPASSKGVDNPAAGREADFFEDGDGSIVGVDDVQDDRKVPPAREAELGAKELFLKWISVGRATLGVVEADFANCHGLREVLRELFEGGLTGFAGICGHPPRMKPKAEMEVLRVPALERDLAIPVFRPYPALDKALDSLAFGAFDDLIARVIEPGVGEMAVTVDIIRFGLGHKGGLGLTLCTKTVKFGNRPRLLYSGSAMAKVDPFTQRRLTQFIETYRRDSGQLPTLQAFEKAGFARELVDRAERDGVIEKFYVTLTNGTIVKGYKVCTRDIV